MATVATERNYTNAVQRYNGMSQWNGKMATAAWQWNGGNQALVRQNRYVKVFVWMMLSFVVAWISSAAYSKPVGAATEKESSVPVTCIVSHTCVAFVQWACISGASRISACVPKTVYVSICSTGVAPCARMFICKWWIRWIYNVLAVQVSSLLRYYYCWQGSAVTVFSSLFFHFRKLA